MAQKCFCRIQQFSALPAQTINASRDCSGARKKRRNLVAHGLHNCARNSGRVLPSFAASVTLNEAEKGREENNSRKEKPKNERKAKLTVIMRAVRSVKKHHQSENFKLTTEKKGKGKEREAPERLQNNK